MSGWWSRCARSGDTSRTEKVGMSFAAGQDFLCSCSLVIICIPRTTSYVKFRHAKSHSARVAWPGLGLPALVGGVSIPSERGTASLCFRPSRLRRSGLELGRRGISGARKAELARGRLKKSRPPWVLRCQAGAGAAGGGHGTASPKGVGQRGSAWLRADVVC